MGLLHMSADVKRRSFFMKKTILVLVLVALVTGGAFAQEWYNSFAPGVVDTGTKLFINLGAGIGAFPIYTSNLVIPPVEANIEYALFPDIIPLTIGGYFMFTQGNNDESSVGAYKGSKLTETAMSFGLRAAWHFNLLEKVDTYVAVGLGWVIWTADYVPKVDSYNANDYSMFGYDVRLGARYYFINNLGLYLELGYNPISFVGAGLALKF